MSFNPFEWFQKTIVGIWQGIQNLPNLVISGAGQVINNVTAPIASAFQQISSWALGAFEGFADSVWSAIRGITDGIGQGLAWLGSSIMNGLVTFVNTLVSGVTGGIQWLWNNLTNALRSAGAWIMDRLVDIGQMFTGVAQDMLNAVMWLPTAIWDKAQEIWDKISDFVWRSVVDVVLANLPSVFTMFYLGEAMKRVHRYTTSPRRMLAFALSPFVVYFATQLALGLSGFVFNPPSTYQDYKKAVETPRAYTSTSKTVSVSVAPSYLVTLVREFEVPIQSVGKARLSGFEAKTPTVSYTVTSSAYAGTYTRGQVTTASATVTEGLVRVDMQAAHTVTRTHTVLEREVTVQLISATSVSASADVTEREVTVSIVPAAAMNVNFVTNVAPMIVVPAIIGRFAKYAEHPHGAVQVVLL